MPWITNRNGNVSVYNVSVYAKEELPTWDEVYNDWYKAGMFMYNHADVDQEMDPYWKIPRRKFLVAVICNQFNKMMLENKNLKDNVLKAVNDELFTYKPKNLRNAPKELFYFEDIRFVCSVHQYLDIDNLRSDLNLFTELPPIIYTIPLPTGEPNPFIIGDNKRIDVSKIDDDLGIIPVLAKKPMNGSDDGCLIYTINPYDSTLFDKDADEIEYNHNMVIKQIMKPFIEYFEHKDDDSKDHILNPTMDGGLLGSICTE